VIHYPYLSLRRSVEKWSFYWKGPSLIQASYDAAHGKPFILDAPGRRHTLVSTKQHIKDLDNAPKDVLSLQAAAKIMLQPKYTMHSFNWPDKKGLDGAPLTRTLRAFLRHDLGRILPKTRVRNEILLRNMVEESQGRPSISHVFHTLVASTHSLAFFSDDLVNDTEFMDAALDFIFRVIYIAEPLNLLPEFLQPMIGTLVGWMCPSQKVMFDKVRALAQIRLDEREQASRGIKGPEHRDCLQWVIEQTHKLRPWSADKVDPWSAERVTHEMIALWFGAMHSVTSTLNYVIQDLCLHSEYVTPLRMELESAAFKAFEATGEGLPLLESFIKESQRMNPLDLVGTRRLALKPFTFSGGHQVNAGEWVCTPLTPMLKDSAKWAQPNEFNGFRHVSSEILDSLKDRHVYGSIQAERPLPITDIREWQTWGTGKMACPGRFYASAMMKQILGLIITDYDCTMENVNQNRNFSWRTVYIPTTPCITLKQRAH
ncbi:cytochrome P450, partial [Pseudovirgaria hyperparasitica]